jgi:hypothetical protein
MKTRVLLGAAALSLLGVLGPGLAGAAPAGSYTATCVPGDDTSVTWRHVKLDQVTLTWSDQAGTAYSTAVVPLGFKQPRGYVITPTPRSGAGLSPTSLIASFEHADGSGTDDVQVACS